MFLTDTWEPISPTSIHHACLTDYPKFVCIFSSSFSVFHFVWVCWTRLVQASSWLASSFPSPLYLRLGNNSRSKKICWAEAKYVKKRTLSQSAGLAAHKIEYPFVSFSFPSKELRASEFAVRFCLPFFHEEEGEVAWIEILKKNVPKDISIRLTCTGKSAVLKCIDIFAGPLRIKYEKPPTPLLRNSPCW